MNKKFLIIGAFVLIVLGYFGYLQYSKSSNTTPSTSNTSTSTSSGVSTQTSTKGTQYLINELIKKGKEVNPDLVVDLSESDLKSNIITIKYKCDITDQSVDRMLASMNDPSSTSTLTRDKITSEQLKVLKVNMASDCNTVNTVLVNKGILLLKSDTAINLKEITPSFYIDKLLQVLPVEFTKSNNAPILVLKGILSYENNINFIFSDAGKKQLVLTTYNDLEEKIKKIPNRNADVDPILIDLRSIIESYTK